MPSANQPQLRASNDGIQASCTCGQPMLLGSLRPNGAIPVQCEYCGLYAEIKIDAQSIRPADAKADATAREAPH